MKRALRIIVPLILTVAVIGCAAWYFLVYDQAFTKEILLRQARSFEKSGNYQLSSWLYDVAYYQSHQDDGVAIELSEQYLSIGNYTKAEVTLADAIAAKPTAKLYMALSALYVQQDKLLDAVQMLDSISSAGADSAIKAELDALRPAAPTLTPEPGFYSQYISVEAACENGTLYVSPDGDFPSTEKDAYTGPITLKTGETVIYALSVGENGLVSPLTVSGYTIGGVIEQVTFADPAMEAAMRDALGVGETAAVFTDQLWNITAFTVPEEAASYEDLALLPYLESLTIGANSTGDLRVIAGMEGLLELSVTGHQLSEEELQCIAQRTKLTHLTLSDCSLSTIAALEPLTGLQYLDLSGNTLRNISVISGMNQLTELYLQNNAITVLDALANMKSLQTLDVSYNSVMTLAPLYGLGDSMISVNASNNQISDIRGIATLKYLQVLDLSFNNITDAGAIAALTDMAELSLSNNALTSIPGFEALTKMRRLNISYNQITELPPFPTTCELVTIDASHNLLLVVDQLAGLGWLNTVNVDYNPELTSLEPLDQCPVLIKVNAYGTLVTEVSFLTAKSIIVNYDPTLDEQTP